MNARLQPRRLRNLALLTSWLLLFTLLHTVSPAQAASADIVISQVFGGGGNSGATYKNDFVELFNRGTTAVSISGWSVQYAAATASTWSKVNLSGTLQPGQYYLVQLSGGTTGAALPAPDLTGTVNLSLSTGKVALVTNQTTLTCGGATNNCFPNANIRDFVGYGSSANNYEGAGPTGTLSNTTAAQRAANGCTDTDSNSADFAVATPNPRNTAAPLSPCGGGPGDAAPTVAATTPASGATNVATNSNITVTFSEAVTVSGSWYSISCPTSGTHTATVTGGPTTFTLTPATAFAASETCTVTITAAQVSDQDTIDPPDTLAANYVWSFATGTPVPRIRDIQGRAHISPKNGQRVTDIPGIVTAKRSTGFYMQDDQPDSDPATSEAIFVASTASVAVGDSVKVSGTVSETRPGGKATNLTVTQITTAKITKVSSGNPLPAATVIGAGGRTPPATVIDDDATGNVETSGTFDASTDGIDFWESLEGMRLQVNNPVVAGPRTAYGEIMILGDNGGYGSLRSSRGALVIGANDNNPERLIVDDAITPTPTANVGDTISGSLTGVLDYDFGTFRLLPTAAYTVIAGGLTQESTVAAGTNELAIATFNVENLDPGDGQARFDQLAAAIVNNLKSPDLIGLQEIQDNSGPTDNGVVDASTTFNNLISAIQRAGGPTYQYRQINPVDGQDGGEVGGNIRQAFLFRTDRGLAFVDRAGGTSTAANAVINSGGPQLKYSPGRIDPTNAAFNSSRKPLAGEFTFNGKQLFVINNHMNSKGGDDPLFGPAQPPVRSSETQRHNQAQIVQDFARAITDLDPNAMVVVMGDLNDFQFSQTITILKGTNLYVGLDSLPESERYSYNYEGNAQALDHILMSSALWTGPFALDVVHINSEFATKLSDHDPQVLRLTILP